MPPLGYQKGKILTPDEAKASGFQSMTSSFGVVPKPAAKGRPTKVGCNRGRKAAVPHLTRNMSLLPPTAAAKLVAKATASVTLAASSLSSAAAKASAGCQGARRGRDCGGGRGVKENFDHLDFE